MAEQPAANPAADPKKAPPAAGAAAPGADAKSKLKKKGGPAPVGTVVRRRRRKVVKKPTGPSFGQRLGARISALKQTFVDVAKTLKSEDRPSRWVAVGFFLSAFAAGGMVIVAVNLYLDRRHEERLLLEKSQAAVAEPETAATAKKDGKGFYLSLEPFLVELKTVSTISEDAAVVNVAEVVMVLECDTDKTCKYITEHLARARDKIISAFSSLDREELMTLEGKKTLKDSIIQKINLWLPFGTVKEIYFTKLIIG